MCFVFKSAVVFLCKERLRQKKKLMAVTNKSSTNEPEIIRYQVLIPVTEVQVRASSAKDMDTHFLWELIHLRSQLQRRSEKVYVLSNSTGEFRNAFLKTIRQIIRESVRNMSIPTKSSLVQLSPVKPQPPQTPGSNQQTVTTKVQTTPNNLPSGAIGKRTPRREALLQTHGARRKYSQPRSSVDRDSSQEQDPDEAPPAGNNLTGLPPHPQTFRTRSKTVSDATGIKSHFIQNALYKYLLCIYIYIYAFTTWILR